ncbi:hypothetical protein Ahy_B10g102347 [Arachis hypogaea]|uniref:CCHC-type domain-containing protein n=1 Tax=Arachis hypogaea TaxID=3818 RepID=A0A444X1Z3_ARAHY|nr:hypothetical protein Ahy_B10g102347 [Arachis hypogaea]
MNIFFEHGVSEPHVVECMSEDDEVILPKNAFLLKLPSTQPATQATKNTFQPTKSHSQPSKNNPLHSPSKNIAKASPTFDGPNPHPKKMDYVHPNTRSGRAIKPPPIQDDSDSHDSYESTEDSLYKSTKVLGDLSDTDSGSDDFNNREPRKTDCDSWHSEYMDKVLDSDEEEATVYPPYNEKAKFGNLKLEVSMIFKSKHHFMNATRDYTIQWGRNIIFTENDNIRVRVVCKTEGCPWFVYCACNKQNGIWQIKTLVDEHTCARKRKNMVATQEWTLGRPIKNRRKDKDEGGSGSNTRMKRKYNPIRCMFCGEIGHNKRTCKLKKQADAEEEARLMQLQLAVVDPNTDAPNDSQMMLLMLPQLTLFQCLFLHHHYDRLQPHR